MIAQKRFSISETVQQFGKKLFGFIRGRVRSNEDAEDILQDVWYQLSNLSDTEELQNVGAWLYRVARNKVTDKYRKKTMDSLDDYQEEDESRFRELLTIDEGESPEMILFKELFWNEMMNALDELPEKQREVFILNEIEDMTLQEIADQKGENLKTVISRKGYAIKHLRNRLDYLYRELNF